MKNLRSHFLSALSAGVVFVVGCSDDEHAAPFVDFDSGNATGGNAGAGTGGRATGGRTNATGGRASGGNAGSGTGGANTGGSNGGAGGAGTGGAATGGAGGAGTGGAGTGGAGTGGAGTGGAGTGGAGTGGAGTGGAGTGGAATGGAGGAGTGGAGTGGADAGAGGAGTGGAGTGGAATGGAGPGDASSGGAPADGGSDSSTEGGTAHKRVFVTSNTFEGNFAGDAGSGLDAADALCQAAADAETLGGTWKAWLSDDNTDAIDRIADVGPWHLITGAKVFDNKNALKSNPLTAIRVDETGTVVPNSSFQVLHPWTGTKADGTQATDNCSNWTSTSGSGECGDAQVVTSSWTEGGGLPCAVAYSLYCFEQ